MSILYSTDCPKCKILEGVLKNKGVEYEIVKDQDLMIEKGFMSAPMFEMDGKIMSFSEAIKFFNNKNAQSNIICNGCNF